MTWARVFSAQSQSPEACFALISTISHHPELFTSIASSPFTARECCTEGGDQPDVLALYQQADVLIRNPGTVASPL